jgi:hypothetical protein
MGAFMAFLPENELEKTMLRAASDQSARPDFYRLLLTSELWLIGELGEGMSLETVQNNGVSYHPVFTALSRLKALAPDDCPHFKLAGRVLFEATRGARFVINPGSEFGKTMTPEEIAWFLGAFAQGRGDIIVAQPKVFPTKLVKSLCILFTSRSLIRAAHLVYVARDGIDQEAHPMIGLEADGDVPRLAQEIFEIAEAVLPGAPIEVVYLDTTKQLDPLQTHLLSVPPFYRRMLAMN